MSALWINVLPEDPPGTPVDEEWNWSLLVTWLNVEGKTSWRIKSNRQTVTKQRKYNGTSYRLPTYELLCPAKSYKREIGHGHSSARGLGSLSAFLPKRTGFHDDYQFFHECFVIKLITSPFHNSVSVVTYLQCIGFENSLDNLNGCFTSITVRQIDPSSLLVSWQVSITRNEYEKRYLFSFFSQQCWSQYILQLHSNYTSPKSPTNHP